MLAVSLCLAGVFLLLLVNEILWRRKFLHGELKRKFVHIATGCFVASWPWLISWRAIQFIGISMVLILLINRRLKVLHYLGGIRERTYGDVFLALGITAAALVAEEEVFFAIAVLHIALADGLAAVIGSKFGKNWRYKVFGQTKSVIGTMTFWIISVWILGIGLLTAHDYISFNEYIALLIVLPPILAAIENLAVFGTDNLAIPIAILWVLQAVAA